MTRARMAGPGRRAQARSPARARLSSTWAEDRNPLTLSCASLRAFARTASMVTDYMAFHAANARAPERPRMAPTDGRASGRLRRSEPPHCAAILREEPRADVFAQAISMAWAPNRATFERGPNAGPPDPAATEILHYLTVYYGGPLLLVFAGAEGRRSMAALVLDQIANVSARPSRPFLIRPGTEFQFGRAPAVALGRLWRQG